MKHPSNNLFDNYDCIYNEELSKNLRQVPFQNNISHFAELKIRIIHSKIKQPMNILDFGCGIGRNIEFLRRFFPDSNIYGTDVSNASLMKANITYPDVSFFRTDQIPNLKFDLILISDVFHHINKEQIPETIKIIKGLLNPTGHVFIFEQNPINPITRYLVKTCIFDSDANLLYPRKLKQIMRENKFIINELGYCFFFPSSFTNLHPYELKLSKFPVGGKYYIWAQ